MRLYVVPGEELRAEVEANARRGHISPERWLTHAVTNFARVYPAVKEGDGVYAAGKGDKIVHMLGTSLEEYRETSKLRLSPGVTPTDLGGYPVGTVIWEVPVDDEDARIIQKHTGTDSPHEAVGYAIWRQNRYVNTLREDLPDWEPGIVLSDGIFRSLTAHGGMRRLPRSTFEPSVPYELPFRDAVREWFSVLMGKPPAAVRLDPDRTKGTFVRGLLYAATDRDHPAEVPHEVIERRPLMELVLFGPSPEDARCICAVVHARPGWGCKDEFRISIEKILYDPVSVAEIRGYLKRHSVSGITLTAGIVGCAHGVAPRRPCSFCPEWSTDAVLPK